MVERVEGDARARNTSVLLRPDGTVAAVYRKLHMFDVDVGGVSYRESAATAPGDEVVTAEVLGRSVGMSVCYDLRFPELYRRLADGGAEIIVVPAAFTAVTGRDHWEPLLRARAIENQAFVIAAGQHGRHDDGTETHGRSMIIDPWGSSWRRRPTRGWPSPTSTSRGWTRSASGSRPCATAGRTSTAGPDMPARVALVTGSSRAWAPTSRAAWRDGLAVAVNACGTTWAWRPSPRTSGATAVRRRRSRPTSPTSGRLAGWPPTSRGARTGRRPGAERHRPAARGAAHRRGGTSTSPSSPSS